MDDISFDTGSSTEATDSSTESPRYDEERPPPFDATDEPIAGPTNDMGLSNNTPCRPVVPRYWSDENPSPDDYLSCDGNVVRRSRWGGPWVPAGEAIVNTMKHLVSDQHDPYSVELIRTNSGYYKNYSTQVCCWLCCVCRESTLLTHVDTGAVPSSDDASFLMVGGVDPGKGRT